MSLKLLQYFSNFETALQCHYYYNVIVVLAVATIKELHSQLLFPLRHRVVSLRQIYGGHSVNMRAVHYLLFACRAAHLLAMGIYCIYVRQRMTLIPLISCLLIKHEMIDGCHFQVVSTWYSKHHDAPRPRH